jgi:hypothetical protein
MFHKPDDRPSKETYYICRIDVACQKDAVAFIACQKHGAFSLVPA